MLHSLVRVPHPRHGRHYHFRRFLSSSERKQNSQTSPPPSPSSFMKSYHLKGVGHQTSVTMTTTTHSVNRHNTHNHSHSLRTDLPSPFGSNSGAQPVEHLLTAYAGCTQATAQFVARNMNVNVNMDSDVDGDNNGDANDRDSTQQQNQKGLLTITIEKMEFDIIGVRDENGAISNLPIHGHSQLPSVPSRLTSITGTIRVFAALKQRVRVKKGILEGNQKETGKGGGVGVGGEKKKSRKWMYRYVQEPTPLTHEQMALLERHTEARCPIANMIMASGCNLDVVWEDGYVRPP